VSVTLLAADVSTWTCAVNGAYPLGFTCTTSWLSVKPAAGGATLSFAPHAESRSAVSASQVFRDDIRFRVREGDDVSAACAVDGWIGSAQQDAPPRWE